MKKKLKSWIDALLLWMGYVPKIDPKNVVCYTEQRLDFVRVDKEFKMDLSEIMPERIKGFIDYNTQNAVQELLNDIRPFIETQSVEVPYGGSFGAPIRKVQLSIYVAKRR